MYVLVKANLQYTYTFIYLITPTSSAKADFYDGRVKRNKKFRRVVTIIVI